MFDILKYIIALFGAILGTLVMALIGFGIGIFAFWFSKQMITFFASTFDNAPLIESTLHFLYKGDYSDIVQYVFIGAFTILIPLSWWGNSDD